MKKKILMAIGAMSAAAVLGLGFAQSVSVSAGPDLSPEEIKDKVNRQYPGEIKELELDEEGNVPIYEVEIVIDGKEYELALDGNSGEVLKLEEKLVATDKKGKLTVERYRQDTPGDLKIIEKEQDKDVAAVEAPKQEAKQEPKQAEKPAAQPKTESKAEPKQAPSEANKAVAPEQKPAPAEPKQQPQAQPKQEAKHQTPASNKKAIITREKAIQIALAQFSGTVDGVDLDDDDGRLVYEVEIESKRGEAEIEIDAYTGKVLVVDIDLDDDDD